MNTVTLSDSGLLLAEGKAVDTRPLMFLNAKVMLAEDCTLRSYFRADDANVAQRIESLRRKPSARPN